MSPRNEFYRDVLDNLFDGNGTNLCKGMCPLARTVQDGEFREADLFLHHRADALMYRSKTGGRNRVTVG